MTTIDDIIELYSSGGENKQKQAIDEAINLAKHDKDIKNILLSIKTEFNQSQLKKNAEGAEGRIANINKRFFDTLHDLETHEPPNNDTSRREKRTPKQQNKRTKQTNSRTRTRYRNH